VKPICVTCGLFFTIVRNGVTVEEGMPASKDDKPGLGNWLPYKLYLADHWRCRGCGAELCLASSRPFSEHYMPEYVAAKKVQLPLVFIKDC